MTLRHIDALFRGDRIALLGEPVTAAQAQLVANVDADVAAGECVHVRGRPAAKRLPAGSTRLAIVIDGRWGTPDLVRAMGRAGYHALFWAADSSPDDGVLRAGRPFNLRVLGGYSAGVASTRTRRNLSTLALTAQPGQVALIAQSQSLTAAALDWALGRNIGFSWLACTGAEADIDAADLLDYAALDPYTRAVVLQIGHIRAPRKFMSAARAAARLKPVLVLQTRRAATDEPPGPDPVRSAAFARAGLVECDGLDGLFDGLAALERLPAMRADRILVLGNGAGVCALATDALLRQRLSAVAAHEDTRRTLSRATPRAIATDSAIDLGHADTEATLAAIEAALADPGADAVLLVHAPVAGQAHAPLAAALARARPGPRLMTVWLGLSTASAARRESSEARLATFASVDEAVRAIGYRTQYHRTRALLTATPPPDPAVGADAGAWRERLRRLAADHVEWLAAEDAAALLEGYGIDTRTTAAPAHVALRVRVDRHPELGLAMSIADDAVDLAPAHGFAPLDALLARRMLDRAGAGRRRGADIALDALARALVRLAKLVIDLPTVRALDLRMMAAAAGRVWHRGDGLIEITSDPPAERERLALAPYPARMRHRVTLKDGARYRVRAIRPPDEPAVLAMLESLSPEEIRLRFFSTIRHFSHDMAARFTQVDYDREVSLVASPVARPDELAGMATLIIEPDGFEAEFALLVHRAHTGVGLGRHLLDCLLRQAGAQRVTTVYGDVLAHNRPMLTLARRLGFEVRRSLDDATSVQVRIDAAVYARARGYDAVESRA